MSDKRNLEFFMANPDQMPGNLDELAASLADAGESVVGDEGTTDEQANSSAASGAKGGEKAAAAGEVKPEAEKPEGEAAKEGEGEAAPVILSKNGKHQIPYSVLETEREQRRAAENALQSLQRQVEELTARVNGTAKPEGTKPTELVDEVSEEDIAAIAEDFPAHGKALKALMAKVSHLTQELDQVRSAEGRRTQTEQQQASATVQEAIDASPQLSYWQSKDPEMFAVAVRFDNQIKADPRNRGLSLDQRFEKVVAAVEAVYGPTELPDEFRRETPAPSSKGAPADTKPNVVANAKKAIQEAEGRASVRSLSDIPGGVPPMADELQELDQLSATELGNKFLRMDPAQIASILARAA